MRLRQKSFSRLVILFSALWCLGFSVGPVLERSPSGTHVAMLFYSGICHQDPARSFSWFGTQWAVCHRCSAIYLSFAMTAIYLLLRDRLSLDALPPPAVLVALLLPVLIDAVADLTGLRPADMVSRLMTGALTGGILAVVVLPGLHDALRKLQIIEPPHSAGVHDV